MEIMKERSGKMRLARDGLAQNPEGRHVSQMVGRLTLNLKRAGSDEWHRVTGHHRKPCHVIDERLGTQSNLRP